MNSTSTDPRVYVTLAELIAMQYKARGFSFLPRQPIHSLLAGRHASRIRGRGLDFEELRKYLPGDDIRTIDWKVTARVREPFVRVYTEERDRPALLLVDQRLSMFFGSRKYMKSVIAARAAALGAWRVFTSGDRVGAIVFNDSEVTHVRPHRSRSTVLRILNAIEAQNRALRADLNVETNAGQFNTALEGALRTAKHDYIVVILSDFYGFDSDTTRLATSLAQHNDVLAFPIFDPLATSFPEKARLVVSDGELQVELDAGKGAFRQRVIDLADQRLKSIMMWQQELAIPVLPLNTVGEVEEQIRTLLGAAVRGPRRP